MVCRTRFWKTILLAAVTVVLTHGAPASALVTIQAGASATFAWDPAPGSVAGYDVFVDSAGKTTILYSTVFGRTLDGRPRCPMVSLDGEAMQIAGWRRTRR